MGRFPKTLIDASSLGSVFLLFPMKVAGPHAHSNRGKSPPPALSDSPEQGERKMKDYRQSPSF